MSSIQYTHLSDPQYYAVFTAAMVSSSLSLTGSCHILYLVWRKRKLDKLYHRLVFGLSIMDIIVTVALALSPILNREDTGLPFAIGNVPSCSLVGFFFIWFLGSYIYNAELSVYFLMMVRYGKREEELVSLMEPYIHLFPFGFCIILGVAGIVMEAINPALYLGVCGFAPYPHGCTVSDVVDCERGQNYLGLELTLSASTMLAEVVGIVSTLLVYRTVRNQTLRMHRRWSLPNGQIQIDLQQQKRIRNVGIQALWYFAAFANGFVVILIDTVVQLVYAEELVDGRELEGNNVVFASLLLMYLFFPMQGFFNCMVYMRPNIIRWKDAFPEKSLFWAYRRVMSGETAPSNNNNRHPPPPAGPAPAPAVGGRGERRNLPSSLSEPTTAASSVSIIICPVVEEESRGLESDVVKFSDGGTASGPERASASKNSIVYNA